MLVNILIGIGVAFTCLIAVLVYVFLRAETIAKKNSLLTYGPAELDPNLPQSLAVLVKQYKDIKNPYSGRSIFAGSSLPVLFLLTLVVISTLQIINVKIPTEFEQIFTLTLFIAIPALTCVVSNKIDLYVAKRKINAWRKSHPSVSIDIDDDIAK